MKIPFVTLMSQYKTIKKEALAEIQKVCDSQSFILGANVKRLEEEIAHYCGTKYAVGVASGTDAILLALMAAGVGEGDAVITTPYTFFATVSSIIRVGAKPIFVDIDPDTYNIDPSKLEDILKKKAARTAKAIIPIHLFGQCADMDPIQSIAKRYNMKIVEDAAQAIGATYKDRMSGSLGDMGCFSFYPSKNLGGFGDGGMVTTSNKRLAEMLKTLRVHGSKKKYYHQYIGLNSRLDEIQAAVLRVKLKYLNKWEQKRILNAKKYDDLLQTADLGDYLSIPIVNTGYRHVFNQYVIRVKKRNKLREYMLDKGIGTEIYYPIPLHLQKCFNYLGYKKGAFPVSEKATKDTLALPIYPEITKNDQSYAVAMIRNFFKKD